MRTCTDALADESAWTCLRDGGPGRHWNREHQPTEPSSRCPRLRSSAARGRTEAPDPNVLQPPPELEPPLTDSAIYAQRPTRTPGACSPCRDDSWPDSMAASCGTIAPDSAPEAIAEPVRASPGRQESPQVLASGGLTTGSPQTKQNCAAPGGTVAMMVASAY